MARVPQERGRRCRALWRRLLERADRSTLSTAAFCRAESISTASFCLWRCRMGEQVAAPSTGRPTA